VLSSGLDRIHHLIVQPDAKIPLERALEENKNLLNGIMSRLKGDRSYRPADQQMFKEFVTMLGRGDYQRGFDNYQRTCAQEHPNSQNYGGSGYTGEWRYGNFYECLTPWLTELMIMARNYPEDKSDRARWLAKVLEILDRYVPMAELLKYLGHENYIFFVRVNGFRVGSEDGDLDVFSNSVGDPDKKFDEANGIMAYWAKRSRISPVELERTQGTFR